MGGLGGHVECASDVDPRPVVFECAVDGVAFECCCAAAQSDDRRKRLGRVVG